ncbi:MAG: DUF4388 domain-containing protein [Desulfobacterales bacterium]|nr:DUF4388 domain-containing protein [Desulfobacterales bacterium]MDJ0886576.1 DUF4388 domain-containing protein [Desulfobacterales bacterium]MDJ0990050.1 DUF4388 domain-containing protein [Desulfobacterales bacterium]
MFVVSQTSDLDNRSAHDSFTGEKGATASGQISTDKPSNGFLHGFTLANFLQYVEMDEKSWTLKIISRAQSGFLHFRDGILLDAQIDGKNGEEAALEILSWDQVDINVEGDCRVKNANLNLSLRHLLLEANRLVDERA